MVGGGSACEGMRLRRRFGVRQGGRGRALMVLQLAVVMPRVAELAVGMAVVVRISRESGAGNNKSAHATTTADMPALKNLTVTCLPLFCGDCIGWRAECARTVHDLDARPAV